LFFRGRLRQRPVQVKEIDAAEVAIEVEIEFVLGSRKQAFAEVVLLKVRVMILRIFSPTRFEQNGDFDSDDYVIVMSNHDVK
jgi:hypothetical protein